MLFMGIGSFVLLLIVVYLIAAPALRPDPVEEVGAASTLVARKERLLADIRELDSDLATGKLDASDHRRFRATALADTAEILQAIEEAERENAVATSAVDAPVAAPAGPEDDDDWIEALIAERRGVLESAACPGCAVPIEPGDTFCRHCGATLGQGAAG